MEKSHVPFLPLHRWQCFFAYMKIKLVLTQASQEIDSFCNEISHMETVVRFLAGVKIWRSYFFTGNLMEAATAVSLCAFSRAHCQNELLAATGEVSTCLFIWEMELKPQLVSKRHRFGRRAGPTHEPLLKYWWLRFSQVLLRTSAEELDCTPGFQPKVFHINQPAEFIEDQPVLNCKQCPLKMLLALSQI